MEIILYITGGIALLALAWLFIALGRTISGVKDVLDEARTDLRTIVNDVDDIKTNVIPILNNVTNITGNVSSITDGVRNQMVGVHQTVDDALDVIRGTLDDLERLKNEVVATVEGPVTLVRETSGGVVSTAIKLVSTIAKLVKAVRKPSMNGQAERD